VLSSFLEKKERNVKTTLNQNKGLSSFTLKWCTCTNNFFFWWFRFFLIRCGCRDIWKNLQNNTTNRFFLATQKLNFNQSRLTWWWWCWCYSTSSEESRRGGTPRKPNNRAKTQGLDQRSKMEVVPKIARRKGWDAGQFRRRWVRFCRGCPQALQEEFFFHFILHRRTREGCDRGSEVATVHNEQDGEGPWASAAGSRGPWPPWIFIHGTDLVNRGLIVLFFAFFCYFSFFFVAPSPGKGIIVLFFGIFFLIFFGLFFVTAPSSPPPWKFFCWRPWEGPVPQWKPKESDWRERAVREISSPRRIKANFVYFESRPTSCRNFTKLYKVRQILLEFCSKFVEWKEQSRLA